MTVSFFNDLREGSRLETHVSGEQSKPTRRNLGWESQRVLPPRFDHRLVHTASAPAIVFPIMSLGEASPLTAFLRFFAMFLWATSYSSAKVGVQVTSMENYQLHF